MAVKRQQEYRTSLTPALPAHGMAWLVVFSLSNAESSYARFVFLGSCSWPGSVHEAVPWVEDGDGGEIHKDIGTTSTHTQTRHRHTQTRRGLGYRKSNTGWFSSFCGRRGFRRLVGDSIMKRTALLLLVLVLVPSKQQGSLPETLFLKWVRNRAKVRL